MGNTETTTELVSTDDASKIAGVSVATINRWAREGRLTPFVQGKGVRGARFYRREDVEAAR
jgi:DNA-binding transcriptional MerR regulator